jgi:hypothetical protein
MILESLYETKLKEGDYIFQQKYYIQNLLYYIRKDKNIESMIDLMEKYSNYDLTTEEFRREIIFNGFSSNIDYLFKILNRLSIFFIREEGYLYNVSYSKIKKCCRTFPDHIGKKYLYYIGLHKVANFWREIIKLHDNGRGSVEDFSMIIELQDNSALFFNNIFHNDDAYAMFQEEFINTGNTPTTENIELKDNLSQIFNIIGKPDKYSTYFDLDNISNQLKDIPTDEGLIDIRNEFLNNINNLLSFDLSHTFLKIIDYKEENHWSFLYLDKILIIFSNNYIKEDKE